MNLKNIIAALATTITVATTATAMADVRVSGNAQVQVQGTAVLRDHRTEQPTYVTHNPAKPVIVKPAPVKQPVIVRDHRTEDHRNDGWNHIHPIPAPPVVVVTQPVVYQPPRPIVTEPTITCNPTYGTNLGIETLYDGETINLSNVRGIDTLQFQWVSGVSVLRDVTVNYKDGVSKTYHLGNALTPHANAPTTIDRSSVIDVDNRPIQSITMHGASSNAAVAQFAIIAK